MDKEKLAGVLQKFLNTDFESLEHFDKLWDETGLTGNEMIRMPYGKYNFSTGYIKHTARHALKQRLSFKPFAGGNTITEADLHPYQKKEIEEPIRYKKPKNTFEVIQDLKILYSKEEINGNLRAKLLTNAIDFLEDKQKQIEEREALREGQSTEDKCKLLLATLDALEKYIKFNFEDEGIYIDSVAELVNEFRAKINNFLKREQAKTKLGFASGCLPMAGTSVKECVQMKDSVNIVKEYIDRRKPKSITIDLSQPIKELKRYNKELSRTIELQKIGKPSELKIDLNDLEETMKESKIIAEESKSVQIRHLAEMQNKTADILKRQILRNGNI